MKLILYFDVEADVVYVPDGYIRSIHVLQDNFFQWADDQQDTFAQGPGKLVCKRYSCDLFLRYLNEEILADHHERAYRIAIPKSTDRNTYIMRF